MKVSGLVVFLGGANGGVGGVWIGWRDSGGRLVSVDFTFVGSKLGDMTRKSSR